ncbi:MAG TPA: tRNA pseudouridine(38-40) synthase TruA [Longimicrobiales bacterium]
MTFPPTEQRIKLTLHYDGGAFFGWQVQPGARTVQAELEAALSRLADRPIGVLGAGRTDRGVHATGQVASAVMPGKWTAQSVRRALNAILPPDVWVAAAEAVPLAFHARYDATAREYEYRVGTAEQARSPFLRPYCWALDARREPVQPSLLAEAAAVLRGEHSFRAFAKSGQPERGERCTVQLAEWAEWEAGYLLRVRANRFLHHMVRYLVGTMVDVARGRRPAGDMGRLLENAAGLETSPPAPAEGLFLTRVYYDTGIRGTRRHGDAETGRSTGSGPGGVAGEDDVA